MLTELMALPSMDGSDYHPEKLLDTLIQQALQAAASDIHIEPCGRHYRIRYRQDGLLYEVTSITTSLGNRLVMRLKVMAQLDIAERRLPQDGRFQSQLDEQIINIRVNTCPTLHGEKVVLRIQDARRTALDINTLGLMPAQKNIFLSALAAPQGMILVTGPTGSGKTVTLYAALQHLNTSEKNISTVEDPIEICIPGVNQIAINPKIGLHFTTVLRTLLRQDPDVLMIGEIRDNDTATMALQAAQTGHLILSTLHTNSALATLSRLQALGIAPYNVVNTITLIIAQRLLRKLCPRCKQPGPLSNASTIFRAQGCQHCLHGYQGRIGIYELLPMTGALAELVSSGASHAHINQQLQQTGFLNLYHAGWDAVARGITSVDELNRVLGKTHVIL